MKLVRKGSTGAWELYDLAADRTEQHDLAGERPELAAELYRQWLANTKSPLVYAAAFNLGALLSQLGNFTEAEQAYRQALAANPHFAQAHYGLALLLERSEQPNGALSHWRWLADKDHGVEASDPGMYAIALARLERFGH
jgi:tetratricopeptide (TPR) repeat protein